MAKPGGTGPVPSQILIHETTWGSCLSQMVLIARDGASHTIVFKATRLLCSAPLAIFLLLNL